jgi:hypothetical protein
MFFLFFDKYIFKYFFIILNFYYIIIFGIYGFLKKKINYKIINFKKLLIFNKSFFKILVLNLKEIIRGISFK